MTNTTNALPTPFDTKITHNYEGSMKSAVFYIYLPYLINHESVRQGIMAASHYSPAGNGMSAASRARMAAG
jgi:hypothetical protein